MRDFFHSALAKILLVAALVLVGLMIRTAVSGGFSSFTANALSLVAEPAQKLSAGISGFFSGLGDNFSSASSLRKQNSELQKQIKDYQSKLVTYEETLRENQQLEAANGIKKENPDFRLKPATVISREAEQWYSTFTVDAGTLDGVAAREPVITSDNELIGIVVRVYAHTSVVATVLDPSVYIGVIVSDTGDTGQSQGDLDLYQKDCFKVGYLSKDSAAAQGDIIVTSGTSGVYPKNLKIGTVSSISADKTGATLTAICKPMMSPANVKNVYILTDFSGKLGDASGTASASSSSKTAASSKTASSSASKTASAAGGK